MKAIHLICKRNGSSLDGVVFHKHLGVFTSEAWKLPVKEASQLVGGRIFLHSTKLKGSTMGGEITGVAPHPDMADRVVFTFRSLQDCRNVAWRGQAHGMAWTGGMIDVE